MSEPKPENGTRTHKFSVGGKTLRVRKASPTKIIVLRETPEIESVETTLVATIQVDGEGEVYVRGPAQLFDMSESPTSSD